MNDAEDLSDEYMTVAQATTKSATALEQEEWLRAFEADQGKERPPLIDTISEKKAPESRPLPNPKPQRTKTDDTLGRQESPEDSAAGTVMRHAAEIPGQAAAGVDSAIQNALSFADPLVNWLNENVADLRFDKPEAKTVTGKLSHGISEFLVGFIPALRGLRAAGMAGNVAPPLIAGMIADFTVRGPHEGRLVDLWDEMGLPPNVLTDYLKSDPADGEIEARFKNTLEGAGLGLAFEGVFRGAQAIRAARATPGVKQAEDEILRAKYGEVSEEEIGTAAKGLESEIPEGLTKETVDEARRRFLKAAGAAAATRIPGAGALAKIAGEGVGPQVAKSAAEAAVSIIRSMVPWESLVKANAAGEAIINPRAYKDYPDILAELEKKFGKFDQQAVYDGTEIADMFHDLMAKKGIKFYSADETSGMLEEFADAGGKKVKDAMLAVAKKYGLASDAGHFFHERSWESGMSQKKSNAIFMEIVDAAKKAGLNVHGLTKVGMVSSRYIPASRIQAGLTAAEEGETIATRSVATAKASDAKIDENIARVVGDPSKPSIEIKVKKPSEVPKKMQKAIEGVGETTDPRALIRGKKGGPLPEDFEVYVNFARFDEPKQVQFVIGKMAEKMKGHVDEARRGVITQKETEAMAADMGMSVTDLMKRRKGQPFNAEEALAARQLWAASGEKLLELAKVAAGKNAGALDQFAFRRQMAVHAAIQNEVIGARTETARALASWKIQAGSGIERARAIEQITQAMGGPNASAEMARRLAILAESGDPASIAKFAQKGWGGRSADAVKEVFINGLLSNPKTHVVNVTSNTLVAFQQIYERAAAGAIRGFIGGEGVQMGEAAAMAYAGIESIKDAFRASAKALRTGETGWAFNKFDLPSQRAISSEAFAMSKETGLGRFVDFLGTGVRVPTRLLGAEDEFFKTIGYRMELRAQALRTAHGEGARGADLAKRVNEIMDNPPDFIRINAADAALYNTFTNEMGKFGRMVMNARNSDIAGGIPQMLVLPFVRTPVNIARYAFERTPFAPLVGQWRADIAAGGARADLALARMATGTAIMLTAMDYADKGLVTGEGPRQQDKDVREALLRQGWQPYSVKIGDRWYSFNRTDPLGMTMGFAASIAESIRKGEIDEDDVDEWHEVAAMSIAAVSQVAINKTYLEGFSKFVEVMADPKRYSQKYIDDMFASFLPLTSLMKGIKDINDPVQREAQTPAEAVMARIAGLSKRLPPRRTLWGEEITSETGLGSIYDFVSPVASRAEVKSPIDREMVRLGDAPLRIAKQSVFDGVRANMRHYPEVYDEYTRLAGNALKHPAWGLGAKDYLNAVVDGKHPMSAVYNVMPDVSRKAFISNAISDYRKLAQQQIMGDPRFRGFAAEVRRLKEINMQSKMPVLGEAQ